MRNSTRNIIIAAVLTLVPFLAQASSKSSEKLNIATFNIRYGTPKDTGVKNWQARKTACISCIRDCGFDVVGIQEALENQQQDLKDMLPEYEFEFVGRNDGIHGEAVGIGYRKDRIRALESGHFWLSPTPDKPSNAMEWGGPQRHRVAIWIKLEDIRTGKKFYYLTTHLEVGREHADVRANSSSLIISKEKEINKEDLPFFVTGDLNPVSQKEEMLLRFRRHFNDSFHMAYDAGILYGPTGTYNGFKPDADLSSHGQKGDYIFGKGEYSLRRYEAVAKKYDGQYPSDHLAVFIIVTL